MPSANLTPFPESSWLAFECLWNHHAFDDFPRGGGKEEVEEVPLMSLYSAFCAQNKYAIPELLTDCGKGEIEQGKPFQPGKYYININIKIQEQRTLCNNQ